jgi:transposase
VTADRDMAPLVDASRNVAAGASSRAGLPAWRKEAVSMPSVSHAPGAPVADVFCGIDVARETHHVVALDRGGRRLVDRPLPNAEPDLLELFAELGVHGRVLVVVDQLASIGALAVAVARSRGITVAYLPGLSMRRIADLYPGEAKTDARDAHIIADAGRTLPHALRRVGTEEQTTVELAVLAGYDADLATEATRLTNRLHDALLHVHPALERLLGNQFRRPGVLHLLAATGTRQRSPRSVPRASRRLSRWGHRGSRPPSPVRSSPRCPSRRW